jgi:phage terminase large subunit GpA-like protein
MVLNALYNNLDLDLVGRGHKVNPDWIRNFREDQDRRTKTIDSIIDMELGEHVRKNTMLQEVYFTKYWGWTNYCLVYRIKERYNNLGILIGAILESTDHILGWYDLTSKFNFNIIIVTPYETFRFTYLDLLYEYVTMSDGNGRYTSIQTLLDTHPRIQQMKEWVIRNPIYERVTNKTSLLVDPYSYRDRGFVPRELLQLRDDVDSDYRMRERMNQYIGGGQQMSYSIEPRVIERPKVDKEWVSKLNKLLNKLKL